MVIDMPTVFRVFRDDDAHILALEKGQKEACVALGKLQCSCCQRVAEQHDEWYALPEHDMEAVVCSFECAGELVLTSRTQGMTHACSTEIWNA